MAVKCQLAFEEDDPCNGMKISDISSYSWSAASAWLAKFTLDSDYPLLCAVFRQRLPLALTHEQINTLDDELDDLFHNQEIVLALSNRGPVLECLMLLKAAVRVVWDRSAGMQLS